MILLKEIYQIDSWNAPIGKEFNVSNTEIDDNRGCWTMYLDIPVATPSRKHRRRSLCSLNKANIPIIVKVNIEYMLWT